MKPAVRLVLSDILARAKWVLIAMGTLQFLFALTFFGMAVPYSRYLILPLMFLGLAPIVAPSRRLLQTLPVARGAIDRLQWLFSGGLVAIVATAASLLAWLYAMVFPLQFHSIHYIHVVTLLFGTPALIGLFMMLRRWTRAGIDPNNQDRPLFLANYFWAPLLMLVSTLIQLSELGPVAIITFGILFIGLLAQTVFIIAPQRYLAWIAKPRARTSKHQPAKRSLISPVTEQIMWTSLVGGALAFLFAWLGPKQSTSAEVGTTLAVIPMFLGMTMLSAIKVLRSLPRSLSQSALILMMIFLIPTFITVVVYMSTCSMFGYPVTTITLWNILAFIAAIAPFAPLSVRIATQARARLVLFYVAFAAIAAWEGRQIASVASQYVFFGNGIAIAIIVATYLWMRHELRVGTMLYRYRSASVLA